MASKNPRRVGHYGAAILWIAQNDDTEWVAKMDEGEDGWSASVTLCLVADIFGRTTEEATADLRRALAREAAREAREKAAQDQLESTRAMVRRVLATLPGKPS